MTGSVPAAFEEALRAEIEVYYSSEEFETICLRYGLQPNRVRQRVLAQFARDFSKGVSLSRVGSVPAVLTWQTHTLLAVAVLDPDAKRGVYTGEAYEAIQRAGFDMGRDSRVRSNYMISFFNALSKKGFVVLEKQASRVKAKLTPLGKHEAELHADLFERYSQQVRRARALGIGGEVQAYLGS